MAITYIVGDFQGMKFCKKCILHLFVCGTTPDFHDWGKDGAKPSNAPKVWKLIHFKAILQSFIIHTSNHVDL